MFSIVNNKIKNYENIDNLKVYSAGMINIEKGEKIKEWLELNYQTIKSDNVLVLNLLISLFKSTHFIKNEFIEDFENIVINWMNGESYFNIGKKFNIKVVELEKLLNKSISYNFSFLIGNVVGVLQIFEDSEELINYLNVLQKKIKYGVKTELEIILYELGFAHRYITSELSVYFKSCETKDEIKKIAIEKQEELFKQLENFLSYYVEVMNKIVSSIQT